PHRGMAPAIQMCAVGGPALRRADHRRPRYLPAATSGASAGNASGCPGETCRRSGGGSNTSSRSFARAPQVAEKGEVARVMGKDQNNTITVLDVGSAKTIVLIAEAGESGLCYRGHAVVESRGSRKGVIVELDKAIQSIQRAVEEAEKIADCVVG